MPDTDVKPGASPASQDVKPAAEAAPANADLGNLTDLDVARLLEGVKADPARGARTIKKLRDEVKTFREKAEQYDTLQQEAAQRAEAAMVEQGEFRELAEQRGTELAQLRDKLAHVQERVSALEPFEQEVQNILNRRIESMTPEVRQRVPDFGDPIKTLAYIDANAALFQLARPAPNMNQGDGDKGGDPNKAAFWDSVRQGLRRTSR